MPRPAHDSLVRTGKDSFGSQAGLIAFIDAALALSAALGGDAGVLWRETMTALAVRLGAVVMNPVTNLIQYVFAAAVPSQIGNAVVGHAVRPVTPFATGWPKSLEGFEHQDMHSDVSATTDVIEVDTSVTRLGVDIRRQEVSMLDIAAAEIAAV